MTNRYYYDNNGQKQEPISGRDLSALTKNSTITPDTVIENVAGKSARAGSLTRLAFPQQRTSPPMLLILSIVGCAVAVFVLGCRSDSSQPAENVTAYQENPPSAARPALPAGALEPRQRQVSNFVPIQPYQRPTPPVENFYSAQPRKSSGFVPYVRPAQPVLPAAENVTAYQENPPSAAQPVLPAGDFFSAEVIEKQIDAIIDKDKEEANKFALRYGHRTLLPEKQLSPSQKKVLVYYLLLLQKTTNEKYSESGLSLLITKICYSKKTPIDVYVVNQIHIGIYRDLAVSTTFTYEQTSTVFRSKL